ncbi:MAG: hypothetical protein JST73_02660 [Actinobacteria bacterium]|nr:hypothetical protein [Actinomycetota bacterium]
MANLTIVVDDETLRAARVRAAEQGTSVNAVLRDELDRYAGTGTSDRAGEFLRLADELAGSVDAWTRDELHLERFTGR